jgi:hypothetical protein
MVQDERNEVVTGSVDQSVNTSLDVLVMPDEREQALTEQARLLTELSEEERKIAYERFEMLRPCLEEGVSQAEIARSKPVSLKTIQRWVRQYRKEGLVGLARRHRSDRGKRQGNRI